MKYLLPVLLLAALPVRAEELRDAIFSTDASCYLRHYDKAHLNRHRDQNVTEVALGPYGPEWGDPRVAAITVRVALRGLTEKLLATAYCKAASGHLACQMEGDAGSFTLKPGKGGKVLMELTRDGIAFEGSSGFFALSGTSGDDREFLLSPAPVDKCP